MGEPENQTEPDLVKRGVWKKIELVWDSSFEFFSLTKLGNYLKGEILEIKNKAPVFFCSLILLIGFFMFKSCTKDTEIANLTSSLDAANKDASHTIDTLKGQLTDAKQDRDKQEQMLAPFQALAIKIYTNVPADERLTHLSDQFISFQSNIVTTLESERPYFELYNDNILLTNSAIISLKEGRTLNIKIRNASTITADQTTLAIFTPSAIGVTNVATDASWLYADVGNIDNSKSKYLKNSSMNSWRWVAPNVLPGYSIQIVNAFTIKTNMTLPVIGNVEIHVAGSQSQLQVIFVTLTF